MEIKLTELPSFKLVDGRVAIASDDFEKPPYYIVTFECCDEEGVSYPGYLQGFRFARNFPTFEAARKAALAWLGHSLI